MRTEFILLELVSGGEFPAVIGLTPSVGYVRNVTKCRICAAGGIAVC